MTIKQLETAAIRAHRHGERFNQFWERHGQAVREAIPHDRARFRRLYLHLMALVIAGNEDGQQPVGDDCPWELDDAAPVLVVSDTQTQARFQGLYPSPGR